MRKNYKSRGFSFTVLITIILLMMSGCSSTNNEADTKNKIRIGYFPNITHAQALIGIDGVYQKAFPELELTWLKFNAGSSEIEALMAGEIDLGYIGPGPAINGYIKSNGDLKILAGASEAGAALICRNDLQMDNINQLSGCKVAIPQIGNTQHVILKEMLKEAGLRDKNSGGDVEIVAVQNPDLITLLGNKSIDAAFVPEPWVSKLEKEAGAKVVLEYNQTWRKGKYPVAVLIGRTEFIEKYPEVVEKFVHTHEAITNELNQNTQNTEAEINKGLETALGQPLDENILSSALNRMIFTTDIDSKAISDMADFMYELGLISEKPKMKDILLENKND